MESSKSFDEIDEAAIMSGIDELEKDRKQYKNTVLIFLCIIHTLFIVAIYLFEKFVFIDDNSNNYVTYFFIYFLVVLTASAFFYNKYRIKFAQKFKDKIIENVIQTIGQNLIFSPNEEFPKSQYFKSEIYRKNASYFNSDDLISGKINEVPVQFAEVDSGIISKGNDRNSKSPIFQGLFFKADFNSSFNSKTFILTDYLDKTYAIARNLITRMLKKLNEDRPPFIKIDDFEFERYFSVYSENEEEAKNILTNTFMNSLTEFVKNRSMPVAISFIDNNLFIAIRDYRKVLDPSIFHPNQNQKMIRNFFNIIQLFTKVINDLKNNEKIWASSNAHSE
ncbi:MAG: DUF3137 domain-containing protein [Bacteroidota bacterium]